MTPVFVLTVGDILFLGFVGIVAVTFGILGIVTLAKSLTDRFTKRG